MKKYQIFRQKAGQQPVAIPEIYDTFEQAQFDLQTLLDQEFSAKDDMLYVGGTENPDYVSGFYYSEPGWYSANSGEIHISDREIDAADFDRYGYDNWFEFIQEVEVED